MEPGQEDRRGGSADSSHRRLSALQLGREQPGRRGPTFPSGAPTAQAYRVSTSSDYLWGWAWEEGAAFPWLSLTPGRALEGTEASGTEGAWGKKEDFPKTPTLPCPGHSAPSWGEGTHCRCSGLGHLHPTLLFSPAWFRVRLTTRLPSPSLPTSRFARPWRRSCEWRGEP